LEGVSEGGGLRGDYGRLDIRIAYVPGPYCRIECSSLWLLALHSPVGGSLSASTLYLLFQQNFQTSGMINNKFQMKES
jgi:hypothetical protein